MLSTATLTGRERDRYSKKESEETTIKQRGLPKTETLSGRALPVGSAAAAHASAAVGGGADESAPPAVESSTAAPRANTPTARRITVASISKKAHRCLRWRISPILPELIAVSPFSKRKSNKATSANACKAKSVQK